MEQVLKVTALSFLELKCLDKCSQAQDLNIAWCCVEPEVRFNGPGGYLQLEIFCDSREL